VPTLFIHKITESSPPIVGRKLYHPVDIRDEAEKRINNSEYDDLFLLARLASMVSPETPQEPSGGYRAHRGPILKAEYGKIPRGYGDVLWEEFL
jgi:hypothetical protein